VLLLSNTAQIFDELESHQVSLQAMQSSSAAGSFQDEVFKWQKQLQMIEAVMIIWLDVQRQWTELEEVRFKGCTDQSCIRAYCSRTLTCYCSSHS